MKNYFLIHPRILYLSFYFLLIVFQLKMDDFHVNWVYQIDVHAGTTKTANKLLPKVRHQGPGGVQSRKKAPARSPKGLQQGPQRHPKSTFSEVPAHRWSLRVPKGTPGTPRKPKIDQKYAKILEIPASCALTASHINCNNEQVDSCSRRVLGVAARGNREKVLASQHPSLG